MSRNKTYLIASIILIIGLITSFSIYYWLYKTEIYETRDQVSDLLDRYANSIEFRFSHNTHVFESLLAIQQVSGNMKRIDFKRFAKVVLQKHPEIRAIEWLPEVRKEEKSLYEQKAREDGFSNFSFTQLSKSGDTVPVDEREYYYPVYYMEPYKGNEKAMGFDSGSRPNNLSALKAAKSSGKISMTPPFKLVQELQGQNSFLIYSPLYKNRDRLEDFQGLFLIAVNASDLISYAITSLNHEKGINIKVYDIDASAEEHVLYSMESQKHSLELPDTYSSTTIEVFGRKWKIEAVATQSYLLDNFTHYKSAILVFMMILSGLFSWLSYMLMRKYAFIMETNDELRRFQAVAVSREERIMELKEEIIKLKKRTKEAE